VTTQSFTYLCFLAICLAAWAVLRGARARQVLLLGFSWIFYATWGLSFLATLVASTLVNFALSKWLQKQPSAGRLWAGLAFNIGFLAFFKYIPGTGDAAGFLPAIFHQIVLPVGASFWTFQAISYLIDLYREEELDPSLVEFSLYMAFWPTVLSGPVCRLGDLLPQFRQVSQLCWDDISKGVSRIIFGLLLKTVFAQTLQQGVDPGTGIDYGFDQIAFGWGAPDVLLLAVGYGLQLFFDFAGYSHIVIGSARLFGIHLAENFDAPYLSTSPSQFWTRWHMSLSFWIRDYVFLPLVTSRSALWWRYFALVASMMLFGLWHGAKWTFIAWGTYQGVLLVLHRVWERLQARNRSERMALLQSVGGWAITFALISLGWIFFRAHDLHQAGAMLQTLIVPAAYKRILMKGTFYFATPAMIACYFVIAYLHRQLWWQEHKPAQTLAWVLSPAYYAAALFVIIAWSGHTPPFLYLQF
jgi:alginate O-acetyltransferase complex protein AlgI